MNGCDQIMQIEKARARCFIEKDSSSKGTSWRLSRGCPVDCQEAIQRLPRGRPSNFIKTMTL